MKKQSLRYFLAGVMALGLPPASLAQSGSAPAARDWTSWGYDQERTGWNRGEAQLSKDNVSKLRLQWTAQLSTTPSDVVLSTLTAPVIVEGVNTGQGSKNLALVLGADDTLFAVDADSGKPVWQKSFPNSFTAQRAGSWLCPNTANDTPAIDKQRGLVFFITSDGRLRALALADGAERMAPADFVAPFARAWSLNLVDGIVYTTSGRGCGEVLDPNSAPAAATTTLAGRPGAGAPAGGAAPPAGAVPPDPGMISAMDVRDLAHPVATHFFTSNGRPNGAWGRGGVAKTPAGIITQTADGPYDPAAGQFGSSVLELSPQVARLLDSFTPANWKYVNAQDLDMGSGSLLTFAFQGRTLAASIGKEAVLYLLDTAALGGGAPDHATPYLKSPQLGNDAALGTEPGQGMWGALATYQNPQGRRFLYMPMWGPPSKNAPAFRNANGAIPNGSIMAFELTLDGGKPSLVALWTSPDMIVPDAPTVANGVVFATQTGEQTLQAQKLPPGAPRPTAASGAAFRATPVSNLILYAFDAETGKQLYSSKNTIKGWTHFSTPVVALGKIYVVTHDAKIYAFGVSP
ncbi:MAG TPA: PQQ-binding-like beta-propeller repeat protein [Rhizomicrobium sp.]|nr:PQQ-binding-like beta-propeller repeat protein [Rhizomicrobium sp.]